MAAGNSQRSLFALCEPPDLTRRDRRHLAGHCCRHAHTLQIAVHERRSLGVRASSAIGCGMHAKRGAGAQSLGAPRQEDDRACRSAGPSAPYDGRQTAPPDLGADQKGFKNAAAWAVHLDHVGVLPVELGLEADESARPNHATQNQYRLIVPRRRKRRPRRKNSSTERHCHHDNRRYEPLPSTAHRALPSHRRRYSERGRSRCRNVSGELTSDERFDQAASSEFSKNLQRSLRHAVFGMSRLTGTGGHAGIDRRAAARIADSSARDRAQISERDGLAAQKMDLTDANTSCPIS